MFRISETPILADDAPMPSHVGASVTFEGIVRDVNDGQAVESLEYEAYVALAEKEGERILDECRAKFDVVAVTCVHRIGHLEIGDVAIRVVATAVHRGAAFDACRYVVDEVKSRVPIWKKEHYAEGAPHWINSDASA